MTIFRDFQGPRQRRDIGIARPRRDRDTQKRVSRPRHVSRHLALVAMSVHVDFLFQESAAAISLSPEKGIGL